MHNRPVNLRTWGDGPEREPVGSAVRLAVLFACGCAALGAIGVRAAWLQTFGRERFTALWDRTVERIEQLPARDGRILTADGQVLAYDEPQYAIAVHYRWLEEPPDTAWLAMQAASRLAGPERRSPEKVAAAKEQVLTQRAAMHRELAAALGLDPSELRRRFDGIQQRVERIVAAVEGRRAAQAPSDAESAGESPELAPAADGWRGIWQRVCRELTTPPVRLQKDPLVVAEELQFHDVATGVPLETVARIESFPTKFTGVDVRLSTRRVYPQRTAAAHVVGVRTPLQEDELDGSAGSPSARAAQRYRSGEAIGRSGIEQSQEATLHGVAGERRVFANRQGEIVREELLQPAVDGRDVILTIDSRLQAAAEELLDGLIERGELPQRSVTELTPDGALTQPVTPRGGCLVAMDVRTGAILAAASAPRFDVALLLGSTPEQWQAALDDPRRPFFPRVTQATLPPGSVFKTLTAIAGLEAGVIDPDERFECQGYLERADRERCAVFRHFGVGHGPVTLEDALAQSCNVYFYDVAQRLGPAPIELWAQRFGFGRPTGCEVPGERGGHVPSPERRGPQEERWYPGTTRQLAVGQASLTVTPLQVVRLMAAIANDGWLVAPHFVREVSAPADEEPAAHSPQAIQLASLLDAHGRPDALRPVRVVGLSPTTLATVRRGLLAAIESPRGTGREAQLKGVRVAGKTGTAETGGGRPDHAWFAGYAPADAPRIAFVVVLEEGGSGGRTAAPLAREFVRTWTELGTGR